jgi:hypothetical protein
MKRAIRRPVITSRKRHLLLAIQESGASVESHSAPIPTTAGMPSAKLQTAPSTVHESRPIQRLEIKRSAALKPGSIVAG